MNSITQKFRQRAHALVDRLPHDATWSDLADYAFARQDMEERGMVGEHSRVAEEVFEEYERIQAELDREPSVGD
jgi:hypothetical protein